MPTQKKIFTVQNLTEKFKQAKGLVLTDYSGLDVNQINNLRMEVKKAGGEFEVVKNRLLSRAASEAKHQATNLELTGQTAALWVYENDPAPLKALNEFIKKSDLPKIKTGFWEGILLSKEKIKELVNLPGLKEMQAKLIAALQSPLYGLANTLGWNIRKLILILEAPHFAPPVAGLR